jgi:NADH-quinone oxidoreductase subunit A
MDSALPIFLFAAAALAVPAGMIVAGWLLGPSRPGRVKAMPYESGMDPIHDTRRRFDVRFYLVAIAFLAFDVELLFLYPWAVASGRSSKDLALWELRTQIEQSADGTIRIDEVPSGLESATEELDPDENGIVGASELSAVLRGVDSAVDRGWVSRRHLVFAEAMVFLGLLALGFVYAWRKGVFRWR